MVAPGLVALVVDSDEASHALIRRLCDGIGGQVHRAVGAGTAMPVVQRHHPSVVITSRAVPDCDGLIWIAQLRLALPSALIAAICETRELAAMDAGADLVLLRPLDEPQVASMLQAAAAHGTAATWAHDRLALLIIEPDPHLSVVMRRWLGAAFDVTVVTTGSRAIEEIRRRRPNAVLAELRLPDMDPAELHAAIDRESHGLAERTLFMTTGFIADRAQQFLAQIPRQWIYKPFDLARLRVALDALVG